MAFNRHKKNQRIGDGSYRRETARKLQDEINRYHHKATLEETKSEDGSTGKGFDDGKNQGQGRTFESPMKPGEGKENSRIERPWTAKPATCELDKEKVHFQSSSQRDMPSEPMEKKDHRSFSGGKERQGLEPFGESKSPNQSLEKPWSKSTGFGMKQKLGEGLKNRKKGPVPQDQPRTRNFAAQGQGTDQEAVLSRSFSSQPLKSDEEKVEKTEVRATRTKIQSQPIHQTSDHGNHPLWKAGILGKLHKKDLQDFLKKLSNDEDSYNELYDAMDSMKTLDVMNPEDAKVLNKGRHSWQEYKKEKEKRVALEKEQKNQVEPEDVPLVRVFGSKGAHSTPPVNSNQEDVNEFDEYPTREDLTETADLLEEQPPVLEVEEAMTRDFVSGSGSIKKSTAKAKAKASSTKKTVIGLILLSAFTKIFGFIREILLAHYYGIGETAEAYKIAQTIPILLLMVVGTGIATGFIPTYNRALEHKGQKKADEFFSNTINWVVIIGVIFCLVVTMFPQFFVKLFASGFTGEKLELTKTFTRIGVWGVIFSLIMYLFQPYLQIRENFWAPAVVGIPMNLIFFASYPLGKINPIYLPLGIVFSTLIQVIWLTPFVLKKGFRWKPIADTRGEDLRHFLMLAAPVIVGVAVQQVNVIVDRTMASQVLDGGVAALDYANRMNGFVQGIFIYSIMSVIYPRISRHFIRKEYREVENMVTNAMVTMSLIVIPCIVGLMVFARPIIGLLFNHGGAFDSEATKITGDAMFYYSPGLIGFAFREVISRVFYSMNDTKTPTMNAAIAVGMNILLNLILSQFMGINGLALATSISAILASFLLMRSLRQKGNLRISYRRILQKLIRIAIASLIMGLLAYLVFKVLIGMVGMKLATLVAIALAMVIYGVVILFMGIDEVDETIAMVKQKLGRK